MKKFLFLFLICSNIVFASSFDIQKQKKDSIINSIRKNGDIIKGIKNLNNTQEQERDLCLALNIYFEVRNCVIQEFVASSYTTLNRYYDDDIPGLSKTQTSLCAVIFAPKQYSWTNADTIPYPKNSKAWKVAQGVSYKILYNKKYYNDHAKLFAMKHYITRDLHDSGKAPKWINNAQFKIQFDGGEHVYMYMKSLPWYKSKASIAKQLKDLVNTDTNEIIDFINAN